jgi:hypothetical protein
MAKVHSRATSGLKLRGDLTVTVTRVSDGFQRTHGVRNTITYDGRNSPLYLWAPDGVTVADYAIETLRTGTSTTPPTAGDTSLGAPLAGGPTGGIITLTSLDRTRSPATGELVITAELDTAHANGSVLTEAGLYLANGQLFSRQIHTAITKNSGFTVSYTWILGLTA